MKKIYLHHQKVTPNDYFIALKGKRYDGNKFLKKIKGKVLFSSNKKHKYYHPRLKENLNQILMRHYHLVNQVKLIGITGTNKKTSTAYYLHTFLSKLGYKVKMISTLDFAQNVYYSMLTTPSQDLFIDYLIKANEEKLDYLIMEVSSIGIAEFRVNGIIFDYGILTFLEVDHLSYHQSILSYHLSKISFLERCKKVFNGLNESYISFFKRICLEFTDNTSFIDQYLKNLPLVPGREEIISTHPLIIIDYAHTISSMEYVLKKYAAIKKGKLIVVFGSGGKRDMNKRKIYGTLGLTYADINIVTSDNPRDENVNKIIRQICARRKGFIKIKLRDKAIKYALNLASAHDTILLLGKGHEKYQEIKGQRFYFNEEEIAKRFLKEKVN